MDSVPGGDSQGVRSRVAEGGMVETLDSGSAGCGHGRVRLGPRIGFGDSAVVCSIRAALANPPATP